MIVPSRIDKNVFPLFIVEDSIILDKIEITPLAEPKGIDVICLLIYTTICTNISLVVLFNNSLNVSFKLSTSLADIFGLTIIIIYN